MKAIVNTVYGSPDVLRLVEMAKPEPGDDDVLVKIHATSINAYDWHLLTADIFLVRLMAGGLFKPKHTILGADIAGVVEAVGKDVRQFHPGDEVYGEVSISGNGGLAEYTCTKERALALKPANLNFTEAAAVPMAALTALQGLRDEGNIQPGQKVLIQGAAGGVGTFAVQIAKAFGAEVTAVTSTRNLEQARSLGADHTIDYTTEDFTKNGHHYDLILGVNGYHSMPAYRRALAPNGRFIMAGGKFRQMMEAMLLGSMLSGPEGKKLGNVSAKARQADLVVIKELIEAGKVMPVIDRCYPLEEAAQALRYLGTGHARGKVVITMNHNQGRDPAEAHNN